MTSLLKKLNQLIHQRSGPLTRELLLAPGKFGLGKVPQKLAPDATTDMVCGYCSTGCGLRVHLKDGEAVNLTPATNYPVNLGMACPEGLGSPQRARFPGAGHETLAERSEPANCSRRIGIPR